MSGTSQLLTFSLFLFKRFNQVIKKIGEREDRKEGAYRNIIGFSFFFGFCLTILPLRLAIRFRIVEITSIHFSALVAINSIKRGNLGPKPTSPLLFQKRLNDIHHRVP